MELNFSSVLVDGSLKNPLVLVATLVVTVVITAVFGVAAWRLSGSPTSRSLLLALAGPAFVVVLMSPFAVKLVATFLYNWGSSQHFSLCFMPSWQPVRDLGPGSCALLVAVLIARWRGRSRKRSDGAAA